MSKKKFWKTIGFFAVLEIILGILAISIIFFGFVKRYRDSLLPESAEHLEEINRQFEQYVQNDLDDIRRAMDDLLQGMEALNYDEAALPAYLNDKKELWHLDEIRVFTKSGKGINQKKVTLNAEEAQNVINNLGGTERNFTINQTTIEYSALVQTTECTLNSECVAAISVTVDIAQMMEQMSFSSFSSQAVLYLLDTKGNVLYKSSETKALLQDNIIKHYGGSLVSMEEDETTLSAALRKQNINVFMSRDKDDGEYIVITPAIMEGKVVWYFGYVVPTNVVNQNMNHYSVVIIWASVLLGILWALITLLAAASIYRLNFSSYNESLLFRERMFDLLTSKTNYIFALLKTGQNVPLYISSNYGYIREKYGIIFKNRRLQVYSRIEEYPEVMNEINRDLLNWKGDTEYVSPYFPCEVEGSLRYFTMMLYAVGDASDEIMVIVQDATDKRAQENALKDAMEFAKTANVAKTEFLSQMSHDIRTPMNAIINQTDYALRKLDSQETVVACLDDIKQASGTLLRLINDVLDMAKIESGKAVIAQEEFNLKDCIHEVCTVITPLCEKKKLHFQCSYPGTHEQILIGDNIRLNQILTNLLNNAVKYTDAGGSISLTTEEIDSLGENVMVYRFTVKDTGIGIRKKNLDKIFHAFFREEKVINKEEGTGLGLAITKNYTEAMDGKISVNSKEGRGSEFIVELPFRKAARKVRKEKMSTEETPEIDLSGKTALLAEDHEVNRMIAKRILQEIGFSVDCAVNGAEAYQLFKKSQEGKYSVIYMDIQMPEVNGYEATKLIRNSEHPQADTIPIIAMTASAFEQDIENARKVGMCAHISKPLDAALIKSTTMRILQTE